MKTYECMLLVDPTVAAKEWARVAEEVDRIAKKHGASVISTLRYGERKLAPRISPGKTVEGAIGGVIGGTVAGLVFKAIFDIWWPELSALLGWVLVIVFGIILSVAAIVGDSTVLAASCVLAASIAGFLTLNYPRGRIFLGDGGAYLVGFFLAELSVLLVHRNSEVSPWFPLFLLAYPIWETLFSMYRRKNRGRSTNEADCLHLHTLVYHRIVKGHGRRSPAARSAMTTLFMLALSLLTVVPAWLFSGDTWVLQLYAAAFAVFYLWIYRRIVRFGVPMGRLLRRTSGKGGARGARHPGGTL